LNRFKLVRSYFGSRMHILMTTSHTYILFKPIWYKFRTGYTRATVATCTSINNHHPQQSYLRHNNEDKEEQVH